jgi:hypothetical protein
VRPPHFLLFSRQCSGHGGAHWLVRCESSFCEAAACDIRSTTTTHTTSDLIASGQSNGWPFAAVEQARQVEPDRLQPRKRAIIAIRCLQRIRAASHWEPGGIGHRCAGPAMQCKPFVTLLSPVISSVISRDGLWRRPLVCQTLSCWSWVALFNGSLPILPWVDYYPLQGRWEFWQATISTICGDFQCVSGTDHAYQIWCTATTNLGGRFTVTKTTCADLHLACHM